MKKLTILFFSAICLQSFSQNVDVQSQQNLTELGLLSSSSLRDPIGLSNPDKDFDVKGSPYFNDDFEYGWIALGRINDTVRNVKLRYNIFNDALELSNDGQIKELNPSPIASFSWNKNSEWFFFRNSDYISGVDADGYLREVYSGKSLHIYMKYSVTRNIRDSSEPYGSSKNYVEYKPQIKTYFLVDDKPYFINNKKDLEALYGSINDFKKVKKSNLSDPVYLNDLGLTLDEN